jgi:UDP-N-acetylmuramate--alanine ligase
VWQPHTYSRTQQLFEAYTQAFADADKVVVTEIYPSREQVPQGGYSSQRVVVAMHHPAACFIPGLPQAAEFLLARLQKGDVVIVLSAGDADQISFQILDTLQHTPLERLHLEERNQSHVC